MRLFFLMVAATLIGAPALAQSDRASSSGQPASSAEDDAGAKLPVSLDRIREGLANAPAKPLLSTFDKPPDFTVEIVERRTIEEILSKLDFRTGPAIAVPGGGLYGYEQQRRLFNPVDHPLVQPYAAFSGAELITIAIENLMVKYLGGRVLNAVTSAERARAEKAARAEVARAIAEYCAAQPDRGESLTICTR